MNKNIILLLLSFFFIADCFSQRWIAIDNPSYKSGESPRLTTPSKYESYEMDFDQLKSILNKAPKRFESSAEGIVIKWPMPNNEFQEFIVKRSDVFHPELAAKYPEIKAFTGHSLSDPTAVLKISISHKGAEGMLLSNRHETIYTDRFTPKSKNNYIVYKRSDYHRELAEGEGKCTVVVPDNYKKSDESISRFGDCQLRKFRLALACTGEYAFFHGSNIPDVLAEYNASMVRVNGIYERDLAITMELIPNTDEIIFLNSATDPYTNNNGVAMLSQNQATINQIIGFNNYDIGHVYSTGGGGIASLGSPCTNRKAQGVTGLGNPTGDFFWVDYVAHEMGHQFGGNHTFNNSCNGNRNNSTAIEPGSGSTIMAYAGICSPNVQNNSDDYFHSVTQNEVANFVIAGNGNCSEIITIDNNPPEIESITETGQILPSRTPFYLTASASDSENDPLTYCWEQVNNQIATMPPVATASGGPAFRSYDPNESPTRYFPRLQSILTGANGSTWEVLPNSNRDMDFNLTVRDNNPLGGCTDDSEIEITFTTEAGPFLITSQNSTTTWNSGETETITWDVANTDQAPVSCEFVDIILSLDRGQNFDIIIAENILNNGELEIVVPFQLTTQGRIMVKCATSTFFDINNRDINILAPFSSEVTPKELSVCPNEIATFNIDFTVFGSNPVPVLFMLNGLPPTASYSFSQDQADSDTEIILTIENLTADLAGDYDLEIITEGEDLTQNQTVKLNVAPDQNVPITYLSPEEGQSGISKSPLLSWSKIDGIVAYEIEVSDNPTFENIVFSSSVENSFVTASGLSSKTIYYWRVRGISPCVDPEWINFQSFQTGGLTCTPMTVDANISISETEGVTIESDIDILSNGVLGELEVSMNINHSWIGDLSASLREPNGQILKLFEQPGVPDSEFGCDEDNIVVTFSSDATNSAEDFETTCNPGQNAIEGTFQPLQSFSLFNGLPINGTWTLIIEDIVGPDGGELVTWGISTCEVSPIPSGVILKNNILQLNNSTEGLITNVNLEMENSDPLNSRFTVRSLPNYGELQYWDETSSTFLTLGLGSTFTQENINMDMIKYVLTDITATEDNFLFDTEDDQQRYTANNTFLITSSIAALSISAIIRDQISCFGESDGRIEVDGIGGIPDYTYSINDGPFEAENIFENLGAGDYTIIVKDDTGTEISSDVLTIVEPVQITYVFFIGDNEITIGGEGGTGALMYSLDGINYSAEGTIPIMDGETYSIFVKDENGCISQSQNEMVFYQIGNALFSTEDIDCKGNETGAILINSVEGGLSPYTYQINEETATNDPNFVNLPAGDYIITIRDNDGNVYMTPEINISEPEFELEALSEVSEAFVSISGNGGTESYLYSINDTEYLENGDFGPLPDGDYIGYVIDANGCTDTTSFTILTSSTVNIELEHLQLVPNPVESNFTFDSKNIISFEYHIFDYTGKTIVKNRSTSNSTISADKLNPGLYFISVKHKDAIRVFKLIKI